MDINDIKERVLAEIDENSGKIIEIGQYILRNPELGYKEWKTSAKVREVFGDCGIPFTDGHAITGVRGFLGGREHNATVCLMGELDAVVCPAHPFADPVTGAAHSCGHNAQIAGLLGAAIGLRTVMNELCGDVVLFAVPAEEYVEIEYREHLINTGKIRFMGGKQELIANGSLDDVDMALMIHASSDNGDTVCIPGPGLGFVGKTVTFKGKEAHAGAEPYNGVNALNAAMASLMCINSIRETFKDGDSVRVHPIITKGGDLVNVVPADVRMETYVRACSAEAISKASVAVNRAIKGGSYAIGAEVTINEFPGYVPLVQNPLLSRIFMNNVKTYLGEEAIGEAVDSFGSTDMGDVGHIVPALHPEAGGFAGLCHSKDYAVANEQWAYVVPAKLLALAVIDLLYDGAALAVKVKNEYPRKPKEHFIEMWNSMLNANNSL